MAGININDDDKANIAQKLIIAAWHASPLGTLATMLRRAKYNDIFSTYFNDFPDLGDVANWKIINVLVEKCLSGDVALEITIVAMGRLPQSAIFEMHETLLNAAQFARGNYEIRKQLAGAFYNRLVDLGENEISGGVDILCLCDFEMAIEIIKNHNVKLGEIHGALVAALNTGWVKPYPSVFLADAFLNAHLAARGNGRANKNSIIAQIRVFGGILRNPSSTPNEPVENCEPFWSDWLKI